MATSASTEIPGRGNPEVTFAHVDNDPSGSCFSLSLFLLSFLFLLFLFSFSLSLSYDFNLQQALAGVPMENQRDRKSFYSPGSITLLARVRMLPEIMNNSKVFAFPTPSELITDRRKKPEMSGLRYWPRDGRNRPIVFPCFIIETRCRDNVTVKRDEYFIYYVNALFRIQYSVIVERN